mgnify:CR=1 FL=1
MIYYVYRPTVGDQQKGKTMDAAIMKKLIERAKKELCFKISRDPTPEEIAKKRAILDGYTRSTYCYAGGGEARTGYDGDLDLPTCDEDYHAVYLAVNAIISKEYGHC